ncbi:MAG: hypothetical protein MK100_08030, partial [Phycisphaerales bacterium]|nr:hypothetical protein [Phycisphaerales bacterium]
MSRISHTFAVLAALTTMTAASTAATVDLAYTPFDADQDDWLVRDTVNGAVSYYMPDWKPSGGVPDGHLEFADITPG